MGVGVKNDRWPLHSTIIGRSTIYRNGGEKGRAKKRREERNRALYDVPSVFYIFPPYIRAEGEVDQRKKGRESDARRREGNQ